MLLTPSVMDSFRRYVQHYSIAGIDDEMLIYPLSPMAWDNMADHWVDDYEAIGLPFADQDYPNRMQPHKFGDDAFAVELLRWETLHEEDGFYGGGVNSSTGCARSQAFRMKSSMPGGGSTDKRC